MIAPIIAAALALLAPFTAGGQCITPEAEACHEAIAAITSVIPIDCAPGSTAFYPNEVAGEYYPDKDTIRVYYGVPGWETVDYHDVVLMFRTVAAHELGHAWWMTHATDNDRAMFMASVGWSVWDDEAAADVFAMTVGEWRNYWGPWADNYPGIPEPTPEIVDYLTASGALPADGTFARFTPRS